MDRPSLIISLTGSAREPLDLLLIEQEEWDTYTGMIKKSELAEFVRARLWGGDYQSSVDCGFVDDEIVCEILVYPREPQLLYQFYTSWGRLGPRQESRPELEEIINFRLTAEESPQYPCEAIPYAEWLTECYDAEGALVPNPAFIITGGSIRIPAPLYGSIRIRYQTNRHRYILSLPRRPDAFADHYSAVVYGLYAGGLNWKDVEMPPDIETFEQDATADCGWGRGQFGPEERNYPPIVHTVDRETVMDYCRQAIITDETHVVG
jgi:hypothetical protein